MHKGAKAERSYELKVQPSAFILEKRPLLLQLRDALCAQFAYASVLAEDTVGRSYRVSRHSVSVGEGDNVRGFVVKVLDGGRYAEYSFNQLEAGSIPGVVDAVRALLAADVRPAGLGASAYAPPEEEPTVFSGATEYEIDPESVEDGDVLARLTALRDKGLGMDEAVLDFVAWTDWQRYTKLFLSRAKDMTQSVMYLTGGVTAAAMQDQQVKQAYLPCSGLGGMELLARMEDHVAPCVQTVLDLTHSESMIPGEYECICDPETTGMIVHEAFGHGVEMDMFVKDRAQAPQFLGKYVASPLVTMHDGACSAQQTATYFFDDEGVLAHDTVVIDKGVLKTGISDLQSALTLGTEPTGNGRRESYARKAYTRMTNTWFEPGTDKLEDMIASVKYGMYLECPSSGMEDPKNWGIQCMVNIAREIKDGKFTGRIFSPVVLTGYVPDLLKSITAMSEAVELSGTGFCGKGHKEWVKVSDGGPCIKATIRLG